MSAKTEKAKRSEGNHRARPAHPSAFPVFAILIIDDSWAWIRCIYGHTQISRQEGGPEAKPMADRLDVQPYGTKPLVPEVKLPEVRGRRSEVGDGKGTEIENPQSAIGFQQEFARIPQPQINPLRSVLTYI